VDVNQGLGQLDQTSDEQFEQNLRQIAQFAPAAKPTTVAAGATLGTLDAGGKFTPSYTAPNPGQEETARHNRAMEGIANQKQDATAKPLPVGALRMAQDARDALSVAGGIDASLARIDNQIATGKLNLGLFTNLVSRGQNAIGASDENSRNYQLMRSTFEKMRNDSLRLNKGVQTEGDAQRAWDELFANLNDENAVRAQLARIREINARATQLQQENMDAVYENYGRAQPVRSSGAAPAAQAPAAGRAPPAAIQYLQQHPELKDQFKAKYGYLP